MFRKLEAMLEVMDVYQAAFPDDTYIAVFDTEKMIGQLQGEKIRIPNPVGTLIAERMKGTVTEKALRAGHRLQAEQDESRFGFPYISTGVPIFENGMLVGCLGAVTSNQRIGELRTAAAELSAVVEEMSATTDEVTQSSNAVVTRLEDLSVESTKVSDVIHKAHSILDFVQQIATQSNLLGLNAAIEAARAGEAGRGFSVVADEIRKMADNSKEAVDGIKELLGVILGAVERMNESVQQVSVNTKEHAASMQELNATLSHIATTAEKLTIAASIASVDSI